MDGTDVKEPLLAEARRLGFAAAGITSTRPFAEARRRALRAIEEGRMDGMPWYTRERVEESADLRRRYPWARSIIALAWPYRPASAPGASPHGNGDGSTVRGRMSSYACLDLDGRPVDYHTLLGARCDALVAWLRAFTTHDVVWAQVRFDARQGARARSCEPAAVLSHEIGERGDSG